MAYVETSLKATDIKKYPNTPMEAYYLGFREFQNQEKTSTIHIFEKLDGSKIEIYGFTMLDKLLGTVPEGCLTKITYLGTKLVQTKHSKEPKPVHQVEVLYDPTKTVDSRRIPASINHAGVLDPVKIPEPITDDGCPF